LKALALGATACGLGKPAVFSMSAYGEEGISRMLQILRDELERCMKLMGVTSLAQLKPSMLNMEALTKHTESAPIPSSPFVYTSPLKNVRSPAFPDENEEKLKQKIKHLQAELNKITDRRERYDMPPMLSKVTRLSSVMLISLSKSVISRTMGGTLHRSGMFLIMYLLIHVGSNMFVFAGPKAFNLLGHQISSSWLIKVLECYLLLAAVLHVFSGMNFSWRKRKFINKAPLKNGKLFLSSLLVLAFIVLHLKTFRFCPWDDNFMVSAADGTKMLNLYKLELETFKNPLQVGFYIASIIALGIHLWNGWSKAVLKMDIEKDNRESFIQIGHNLIWPLCLGFIICVIYMSPIFHTITTGKLEL